MIRPWEAMAVHLGETEIAPNDGPWIRECLAFVGVHSPAPWCCASFVKCAHLGGVLLPKTASVHHLWEQVQDRRIGEIEEGCGGVHLNPDGTGHIVFVLKENRDGTLRTLSGNTNAAGSRTGGQVAYVDHPYSYFVGGGFFHMRQEA